MNRKEYRKIFYKWQRKLLKESFTNIENPDGLDRYAFGFKDEDEENYSNVAKGNTTFYREFDPIDDADLIKKFNLKDNKYNLNKKIFKIIKKIENYVQEERDSKQDQSIKGKIILFEDEDEGFIKFDFSGFTTPWNETETFINSTLEFEPAFQDFPSGYGGGAYRHMLTHKSTLGVSVLLFEILLEFVSIVREQSICSDRYSATPEAQKKWQIYANRTDIETVQMDINKKGSKDFDVPQLTPEDVSDDTAQDLAIKHKGKNWYESIFSKSLKKTNMNTIKYIANESDHIDLSVSIINSGQLTSRL